MHHRQVVALDELELADDLGVRDLGITKRGSIPELDAADHRFAVFRRRTDRLEIGPLPATIPPAGKRLGQRELPAHLRQRFAPLKRQPGGSIIDCVAHLDRDQLRFGTHPPPEELFPDDHRHRLHLWGPGHRIDRRLPRHRVHHRLLDLHRDRVVANFGRHRLQRHQTILNRRQHGRFRVHLRAREQRIQELRMEREERPIGARVWHQRNFRRVVEQRGLLALHVRKVLGDVHPRIQQVVRLDRFRGVAF